MTCDPWWGSSGSTMVHGVTPEVLKLLYSNSSVPRTFSWKISKISSLLMLSKTVISKQRDPRTVLCTYWDRLLRSSLVLTRKYSSKVSQKKRGQLNAENHFLKCNFNWKNSPIGCCLQLKGSQKKTINLIFGFARARVFVKNKFQKMVSKLKCR